MKCQQQRQSVQSVTMRFALTMPPCNGMMIAVGGVLLKLRYVSCKVWAKVVCCKLKLLHCQDSFSAARQISVALLTKRSKSTSRLKKVTPWHWTWILSTWENTWHPKSTLHWLNELATVSVSVTTVSERSVSPKILKEVNHERKTLQFLRSSRLCLSSLLTSQWVLCQLEVCPYKPRDLSLLGQSVVG